MKNNLLALTGILFGCVISSAAFSDYSAGTTVTPSNTMIPATTTPMTPSTPTTTGPCQNIMGACKAAGMGVKNCMMPIMSGKTVAGVTVNPTDVQGCQVKMKNMRNKM